jgi:hypothetical protein
MLDGGQLINRMPTTLLHVRTFKQLVRYLEDELGWPLEGYSVVELTFEYDAADLGLKPEEVAKIKSPIRQLRPLTSGQPWGIFFIEFDRKRLPIAVLRRILSHLVVKKRASASKADNAAWKTEDLLFISAFGAEDDAQREITFAHFHQDESEAIPTLRVLGWDGNDTNLKIENVDSTLHEKLRWQEQGESVDEWRNRWSGAFRHRVGHVIRTADMLAEEMASLARRIRDAAVTLIAHENENGRLKKLHRAFQTHLIHDLTEEGFADTYAQTITYGLLTAAISGESASDTDGKKLVAEKLTDMVPVTNPFLKEMLQTFLSAGGRKARIDFDELGVQDVVELLRGEETDLPAVLRDFGNRTQGDDPVIHFYEHFLNAYNKQLKIQRGVFYTPQPVVSYIVRSVHELLQTEFALPDGLADTTTWGEMVKKHPDLKLPPLTDESGETRAISPDEPFVQILDPATGTATFLVEVIDVIYRTLSEKWKKQRLTDVQQRAAWNEYVPQHLLPRLHAFELMMAPYAIAHMKIGLKLAETGYRFGTEERARIYLTNALEPKVKQLPQIGFDALAHEAAAVNEIKWYKRFTVVIGNPPYSNFGMLNKNPFILGLLEDYKRGLDEKKINLDDDFIKFVRFSQATLGTARVGILGFITNNVYLDGMTHRRMRQSLLEAFPSVWLIDLHGSAKKLETARDSGKEENVFDIQQGVSVGLFARTPASTKSVAVHADIWGTRESKYRALNSKNSATTTWSVLKPTSPHFFFVPKDFSSGAEYESFPSLAEAFSVFQNGLKTDRDDLFFDFNRDELEQRIRKFYGKKYDAEFVEQFGIHASSSYDIEARRDQTRFAPTKIQQCLYRPFDFRWLYYDPDLTSRPASKVMRHQLAGKNIALVCLRQTRRSEEGTFFVSQNLINKDAVSLFDIGTVFPLFLYDETLAFDVGQKENGFAHGQSKRPNLAQSFLTIVATALQLPQKGAHGLPADLTPEDIFHYVYAVFHSPGYRCRYAEFLKIDFPRLPLTGSLELFRALARLGGELIGLHLMESPALDKTSSEFIGGRAPEIEKVQWSENTVWLDKSKTTGFRGVPEEVWDFHIGGYQVCEKWLKDRKGRNLTADDRRHYQKIIVALSETIWLMKEVDAVIEKHGGWPGAFVTTSAPTETVIAKQDERAESLRLNVEGQLPLG